VSSLELGSFYILANAYAGSPKQFASNDDALVMESSSTANSHQWYFTSTAATALYRLHTRQIGDSKSLDVINIKGIRSTGLHFVFTGQYTR
ncbi:hypothetical protein DM02DRAFT_681055, partial [Periconia macrospinosa]